MKRLRHAPWLLAAICLAGTALAVPRTHVVCPADGPQADCGYIGGNGIQAAIDEASDGDTVAIRAGRYSAAAYRDVPYKKIVIRGFVVVDGKDLTLAGDPGAVLDGATGPPTTAIIVRRAAVTIRGLTLTRFRFDVQEDEIYEGHGLFVIDGRVRAEDLTISKFQKMGLIGRGTSELEATNISIVDGHVGIWLHETAYLRLTDSIVSRNDSSAIAAYDNSVAHVSHSAFEGNLDDGLFSEHEATIYVTNSLILRNKPYGARAVGDSRIWLGYSVLYGNERDTTSKRGRARVRRGPNVFTADPLVGSDYRLPPGSPLAGKGDPDLGDPVGAPSEIGPRPRR